MSYEAASVQVAEYYLELAITRCALKVAGGLSPTRSQDDAFQKTAFAIISSRDRQIPEAAGADPAHSGWRGGVRRQPDIDAIARGPD